MSINLLIINFSNVGLDSGVGSHLLQVGLWWLLVLVLDLRSLAEVRCSISCAKFGSWTKQSCSSSLSLDTSDCKARIASLIGYRDPDLSQYTHMPKLFSRYGAGIRIWCRKTH